MKRSFLKLSGLVFGLTLVSAQFCSQSWADPYWNRGYGYGPGHYEHWHREWRPTPRWIAPVAPPVYYPPVPTYVVPNYTPYYAPPVPAVPYNYNYGYPTITAPGFSVWIR